MVTGATLLRLKGLLSPLPGVARPHLILTGPSSASLQGGHPEVSCGASTPAFTGIAENLREGLGHHLPATDPNHDSLRPANDGRTSGST
jgi:hypothetical protein